MVVVLSNLVTRDVCYKMSFGSFSSYFGKKVKGLGLFGKISEKEISSDSF